MFLTKFKTVMAVLVVLGVVALGGGLLSRRTGAAQQGQAEKPPAKGTKGEADAPKKGAAEGTKKTYFYCAI